MENYAIKWEIKHFKTTYKNKKGEDVSSFSPNGAAPAAPAPAQDPAPAPAPAPSKEEVLLTEIRDLLKEKK